LKNLADKSYAYGIPGKIVDGNDVLAVYEVVGEAVARAKEGEGPTLIECKTSRWHGHEEGDTETYRTKEEKDECRKKCPILRFRKHLIEKGVLAEEDADTIDREMRDEIEYAVKFAEESPLPAPEETLEDVYA